LAVVGGAAGVNPPKIFAPATPVQKATTSDYKLRRVIPKTLVSQPSNSAFLREVIFLNHPNTVKHLTKKYL
jgi:hypothetical protein